MASTPAVGITLDDLFVPSASHLASIAPVSAKWVEKEKPAFNIEAQDAFSVSLTTFDGYHYGLDPRRIYVEFRHRLRLEAQSAGPPIAVLASKPAPFTKLLPEVIGRLLEATRLSTAGTERKLLRVGFVTNTTVHEDEAPPGVLRFLEYIGKPWKTSQDQFTIEITSKLPRRDKAAWQDRCQHALQKQEFGEGLITVRLDWHRMYDSPTKLSIPLLEETLEKAQGDALAYFEDIGQGDRFDESIISSGT